MNKFEIKMDDGDIFYMTNDYNIKEISEKINKVNVETDFISDDVNFMVRVKNIKSIELIEVTL